jgi:hypothetical protein
MKHVVIIEYLKPACLEKTDWKVFDTLEEANAYLDDCKAQVAEFEPLKSAIVGYQVLAVESVEEPKSKEDV